MSDFFSGNLFDLAIYVCLFVAVVMGFMTGLLRSLATIFGYVCGMGVAVVAAPKLTSLLASYLRTATDVDRGDRDLRRGRSRDWRTSSTGCR
jgi:xanthine/uracil permease